MFYLIKRVLRTKRLATSLHVALLIILTLNTQGFAVDIVVSKDSLEPSPKKEEISDKSPTWIHLDPSIRPAYVGIHGGTAPVTLLRGTDGSVYAITGQTGNDFILALRSGNASAEKSPEATLPEEKTIVKQTGVLQGTKEVTKEDISTYERWGDSTQWMATLTSYLIRSDSQDIAKNEIIQPKPKDYPDVVFTSEEKFKRLTQKNDAFQSFGFSDSDMPPATSLNGTRVPKALILELKDYRDVLGSL